MAAEETTRRAAVIGVDTYKDDGIPDLAGATNDAREMHDRLTSAGDFVIDSNHFLLNEQATAERVRGVVSDLLWSTDRSDLTLLYFSGHGLIDGYGHGYIAPHDMVRQRPLLFGLRMRDLRELLLATTENKRTIVVILDCCYSGIAADGTRGDEVVMSPASVERAIGSLDDASAGRIIMASSPKDERSRERPQLRHRLTADDPHDHGLFTFYLLEGLDGGAAEDGQAVMLETLVKYVETKLADEGEVAPQLFMSSAHGLGGIRLGRASRQMEIQSGLAAIRERLATHRVSDLFRAIDQHEAIRIVAPGLAEIPEMRRVIDDRLVSMQDLARGMLLDNKLYWSERCETAFDRLERIVCGDLTCKEVVTQDKSMRGLLATLLEVTHERKPDSVLIEYLCNYDRRSNVVSTSGKRVRGTRVD